MLFGGFKKKINRWHRLLHSKNWFLGASLYVFSIFAITVTLVVLFTVILFQPYRVQGTSMHPTFHHDDRVFVLRFGRFLDDLFKQDHIPKRGEIVVLQSPTNNKKWIKRIIGLPNERLILKNNLITIYNQQNPQGFVYKLELDPPLESYPDQEPIIDTLIEADEIFVLGDNHLRNKSEDSRQIGNLKIDQIVGRVVLRILPFESIKFF